jgi:putative ABC transport system ATP-binding protein
MLELNHVSKHYGRGRHECVALNDVSLQIEPGEMLAVWGRRRSGRSTLLRIAAGVEAPDAGIVSFQGHDLAGPHGRTLLGTIRYCRKTFRPAEGQLVMDQLTTGQLTRGVSLSLARTRARDALKRVGAEQCATLRPSELDSTEAACVAIARALAHRPKLLVIDEPTLGVDLLERDRVLMLLRTLADEGIAVLASAAETSCLSGADRALTIGHGELHGQLSTPELAPVVPLRRAAGQSAVA